VQSWTVGDERAETYLARLAEAELRRTGDQLRRVDTAAEDAGADPGMTPFAVAEGAAWKVGRTGRVLVAAGVLDQDYLHDVGADLGAAIKVRSRFLLNRDRRRGMLNRTIFEPPVPPPSRGARHAMRVTPVGGALRGAGDRAPWTLHLMSLMRTETEAVITVAMRMHWPPDGSSVDLELTGAGPHHMPYDQLGAVDDQGTHYAVRFEGGRGDTATWLGFARLSPVPPHDARRLDLIGDGTRLTQLPLGPPAPPGRQPAPPATERVALEPSERLLVLEAEHILTTGDATGGARGQVGGPSPGEIITVLLEAAAIAADSPLPGQLAALCLRLGAAGHGITVPPGEELPAPWASVIAHRDAPVPPGAPEVFAPLACVLPDVDGACFALAGLSTVAGESHLHVISSGMPPLAGRFAWNWTPGYSWWLRDSAGNWHVGSPGEPDTYGDGMSLYSFGDGMQAFWLRLTPPLTAPPAEIVVTGPATQVRATISDRG
jgi:hypothetical protein